MPSTQTKLYQIEEWTPFLANANDGDFPSFNTSTEVFDPVAVGGVFGTLYEYFLEIVNLTTSSTSWQTYQSVTTASKLIGKYRVMWQFTWSTDNRHTTRLNVRVRADGNELYETRFESASAENNLNSRFISVGWADYDLAADGTIDLLIQMRRQGNNDNVKIYNSEIQIYRIS